MRIRYGWELALAALLVIEIVAFGAINPRMLDLNMLLFSTSDFICIGIVALPLTMVIVSGGIDISFGSTIGLCAIALGVLFQSGVPMPLAILLTLLLGALCGLINAGLIIYTKVNPLVITLGTLYLFAGSALLLSGMAGATGYEGIGGFPMAFTDFANNVISRSRLESPLKWGRRLSKLIMSIKVLNGLLPDVRYPLLLLAVKSYRSARRWKCAGRLSIRALLVWIWDVIFSSLTIRWR